MSKEKSDFIEMAGYLEKKCKLRISRWKNYWFVLNSRLLLYYRSREEYEALSPCKGIISLPPLCKVKPLPGQVRTFQIETRSNSVTLRAKNRLEKEEWMQAILLSLNNNVTAHVHGLAHFRYSFDSSVPKPNSEILRLGELTRQNTMPNRPKHEEVIKSEFAVRKVEPETSQEIPKTTSSSLKTSDTSTTPISPNHTTPPRSIFQKFSHRVSKKAPKSSKGMHLTYPTDAPSSSDNVIIDNDQYFSADDVLKNRDGELLHTSIDGTCLKSQPPSDNTYERLSSDYIYSKLDTQNGASGILCENSLYADLVVENDQYCTPDVIVGETNTVNYHEYKVPASRSESVYSEPHRAGDNETGSRGEVSKLPDLDVNPYSVCHLYPKTPRPTSELLEEQYATTIEYAEIDEATSKSSDDKRKSSLYKVGKLFLKMIAWQSGSDSESHTQIKPKTNRKNMMRNIFKKKQEQVEDVCDAINDEDIYATIDEEMLAKLESEKNIDKKMLEELKAILMNKKQTLKDLLEKENSGNEDVQINNPIYNMNHTSKAAEPSHPTPINNKLQVLGKSYTNSDFIFPKLKKINEKIAPPAIADRKPSTSLSPAHEDTTENVKDLIEKFDNIEHESTDIKSNSLERSTSADTKTLPDVVSQEKSNDTCKFSPDLHRLLEKATERPKMSLSALGDTKSFNVLNLEDTTRHLWHKSSEPLLNVHSKSSPREKNFSEFTDVRLKLKDSWQCTNTDMTLDSLEDFPGSRKEQMCDTEYPEDSLEKCIIGKRQNPYYKTVSNTESCNSEHLFDDSLEQINEARVQIEM